MSLLDGLNEQQLQAVTSTAPNILCLAGAGSGKTTVLTRRIAHLHQEQRIGTSNMLALTFTRLAALEMKERVIRLIGEEQGKKLFCGTFHAFAVAVLRRWGHKLGIDANFTIYDQEDRDLILRTIIDSFGKRTTLKKVIERHDHFIDVLAEERLYPEESRVLKEYGFRCRQNNAVDLNRLVDLVIRLWDLHPDILYEYQQTFTHIFLDEFQDTNDEQALLCKMLNAHNAFLVGDDYQAIYGWRGANVQHIIELATRDNIEVIKLEDNYRSTDQIVAAANTLIGHNINQTKKTLLAHKQGRLVRIASISSASEEAIAIANTVNHLRGVQGIDCKDIAVLCRTNQQIENLETWFKESGIPAKRITASDDPYKGYAVRPVMDWMYFIHNKKDNIALKKVLRRYKPTPLHMQKFELQATQQDTSLYETIFQTNGLPEFIQDMVDLEYDIMNQNIYRPLELFDYLCEALLSDQANPSQIKKARIAIEIWQKSKLNIGENVTVPGFLKYLRYRDIQEKLIEKVDAVKLMTVHASKGLEFHTVFIAGMNEGVFPSKKATDIEEERRLFYVAITRAKENLFITWPMMAPDWSGSLIEMKPSPFLAELGIN
jgi:DNA helicase-2/ATP-dependent DNA helicase PcrA